NEQLKHFSENKEKLILQKNETTTLIEKRKQLLSQEKNKLDMLQMERNKAKEQLNQLKNKLTVQKENISEQIEELKSDYIEYLNEQAAKRNEKQSIQQQLQQIKRKKDQQTKKFQDFIPLRESLTEQQKEVELLFSKTENKCLENEATIQQLKKELEIERNSFQESQKKLYKGYQYIEKLKSKKEMLEEMKTEFQGFYQGVKAILKARDRRTLKNIHGAVIELIDVPKTYITAIETILGGQTQYIVVNDDQAAREAISWLKKTKNGRATFLPLRSVQPRFLKKEALQTVENHRSEERRVGKARD